MQHQHNELYYNYNAQSVEVDHTDIWPWGGGVRGSGLRLHSVHFNADQSQYE